MKIATFNINSIRNRLPRLLEYVGAQPPRKRLQNVTLLSSGERSLAALALVLADQLHLPLRRRLCQKVIHARLGGDVGGDEAPDAMLNQSGRARQRALAPAARE